MGPGLSICSVMTEPLGGGGGAHSLAPGSKRKRDSPRSILSEVPSLELWLPGVEAAWLGDSMALEYQ